MADIEAALAKARALAKQAKSASEPGGGGLAAVAAARTSAVSLQPDGRVGSVTRNLNSDAPHMRAQAEGRRLFIGGMSYETTDHSLEAYLNMRWPTEEAKVKRDMDGRSRGFAFVSFPSVAILEACFDAAPHFIDGKKVEMRKVSPDGGGSWGSNGPAGGGGTKRPHMGMTRYGDAGAGGTRVYIGSAPSDTSRYRGLNDRIEDEDLRSYFERYGTVTGVAQHRWEDTGNKKGFGYIEFGEYEAAQACKGEHTICGQELLVKDYQQGGGRGGPPPERGSSGGGGYSYGYGQDNKRSRPGDGPWNQRGGGGGGGQDDMNAAGMLTQMKAMMSHMQSMQAQMAMGMQQGGAAAGGYGGGYGGYGGYGAPGYGQQQQAAPGYGQSGYQYPTGGVEYPKPRSRDPKPPGTGNPYEDY